MSFHGSNHSMWNNKSSVLTRNLDENFQTCLNAAFAGLALETSAPPPSPVIQPTSHGVSGQKRLRGHMAPEPTLARVVRLSPRKYVKAVRKAPPRCASDPGKGASAYRFSVKNCGLLLYEPTKPTEPTEGVKEPPQKKQHTQRHSIP